jgi:hypothetical protein
MQPKKINFVKKKDLIYLIIMNNIVWLGLLIANLYIRLCITVALSTTVHLAPATVQDELLF